MTVTPSSTKAGLRSSRRLPRLSGAAVAAAVALLAFAVGNGAAQDDVANVALRQLVRLGPVGSGRDDGLRIIGELALLVDGDMNTCVEEEVQLQGDDVGIVYVDVGISKTVHQIRVTPTVGEQERLGLTWFRVTSSPPEYDSRTGGPLDSCGYQVASQNFDFTTFSFRKTCDMAGRYVALQVRDRNWGRFRVCEIQVLIQCIAGTYYDATFNECRQCRFGKYCLGSKSDFTAPETPCPAGRYNNALGGTKLDDCALCDAGYLCSAESPSATQAKCGAATRYCPRGGTAPQNIEIGHYGVGASQTTISAQSECRPGSYCTGDGFETPCPAGKYGSSSGLETSDCSGSCSAGYYCEAGSASAEQAPCGSAAVYCPSGRGSPLDVDVGHYSSGGVDGDATATTQTQCPPGSYCTGGVIKGCPAGRYSSDVGATAADACDPCTAGYFCDAGSSSPAPAECGTGHYCPSAAPEAVPCPPGRYQDSPNAVSEDDCTACPANTATGSEGNGSADDCTPCEWPEGSGTGARSCWPGVVSIDAQDPAPLVPGISPGDTIVIQFSKATQQVPVEAQADVLRLVSFSRQPAAVLSAAWADGGRQLRVTLVDGIDSTDTDFVQATAVGTLKVGIRAPGEGEGEGITDAEGVSGYARAARTSITGTYGQASVPDFLRSADPLLPDAEAEDGNGLEGLGVNDTLLLRFDQPTMQVPVATRDDIDRLLFFSGPLGDDYTGEWLDSASELRITVRAAYSGSLYTVAARREATRVGTMVVEVLAPGGLTSLDGSTDASTASAVLGGSWGDAVCNGRVVQRSHRAARVFVRRPVTAIGWEPDDYRLEWSADAAFADSVHTGAATMGGPITGGAEGFIDATGLTVGVPVHFRVAARSFQRSGWGPYRVLASPELPTDACVCVEDGTCADQFSAFGLTPQRPQVRDVEITGSTMSSLGGETVTLVGSFLGIDDGDVSSSYSNGQRNYTASDCAVLEDNARVQCRTAPGIGKGYIFAVAVDGASNTAPYPPPVSYSPPVITGFSGAGASDGSTQGGQWLSIQGQHFGEPEADALDSVTYSIAGVPDSPQFTPECVVVAASAIECNTTAGAGMRMDWVVTVDGQASTMPSTSYAAPHVDDVFVVGPGPDGEMHNLTTLPTGGGVRFGIRGRNFGLPPEQLALGPGGSIALLVALSTAGDVDAMSNAIIDGTATTLQASDCVITVAHSEVQCTTVAGVGSGYRVAVAVADQRSGESEASLSYGAPTIDAISPATFSTAGDNLITLTGTNFGAAATAGRVQVLFAGQPVAFTLTAPHTTLQFRTPEVQLPSGALPVTVVAGGRRSSPSLSSYMSPTPWVIASTDPLSPSFVPPLADTDAYERCEGLVGGDDKLIVQVLGSNFGTCGGDCSLPIAAAPAIPPFVFANETYPCVVCLHEHGRLWCVTEAPEAALKKTSTPDFVRNGGALSPAVEAEDGDGHEGLGVGDSLLLRFDQSVIQVDVSSTARIDDLLSFSAPIGGGYVGEWLPGKRDLRITVTSPYVGSEFSPSELRAATRVGTLSVTVKASGGLTSLDGTSSASTASAVVAGSWGDAVCDITAKARSHQAIRLSFAAPTTAVGYTPASYRVQWSPDSSFADQGAIISVLVPAPADGSARVTVDAEGLAVDVPVYFRVAAMGFRGEAYGPARALAAAELGDPCVCAEADAPCGGDGAWVAQPHTPQLPAVTRVEVPGGGVMATTGGAPIAIIGRRLGIQDADVGVVYSNGNRTYTAASCVVEVENERLVCVSVPGVGMAFEFRATVDGGTSPAAESPQLVSYAAPVITGFAGPGAEEADTPGGQLTIITGSDFGPPDADALDLVFNTVSGLANTPVFMPHCWVQSHNVIRCNTTAGAGRRMDWVVVVEGQASTTPSTSYGPPVIMDVHAVGAAGVEGGGLGSMATVGGEAFVILGRNFGPRASDLANGTAALASVSHGHGQGLDLGGELPLIVTYANVGDTDAGTGTVIPNTALTLTAAHCAVTVAHTEITCETVPGLGSGYKFVVEVAGQRSADAAFVASYAAPTLSTAEPADFETAGGTLVSLEGSNFGPLATADRLHVYLGSAQVDFTLSTAHRTIDFVVPEMPQPRGPVSVYVEAAGKSSGAVTVVARAPLITSQDIVSHEAAVPAGHDAEFQRCVDDARRYTPARVIVGVRGANFGKSGQGGAPVTNAPNITFNGNGGVEFGCDVCRHEHTYLWCVTDAPRDSGALAVQMLVGGVGLAAPSTYDYEDLTQPPRINTLDPPILAVAGGTHLSIGGTNFKQQGVVTLERLFFTDAADGSVVPLPANDPRRAAPEKHGLAASHVVLRCETTTDDADDLGPDDEEGLTYDDTRIVCRVPAGTGTGYQVKVLNSALQLGTSQQVTIAYEPPLLASAEPALLPSQGGVLTLHGSSLGGDAPTFTHPLRNFSARVLVDGRDSFPVLNWTDTTIRCVVGPGIRAPLRVSIVVDGLSGVLPQAVSPGYGRPVVLDAAPPTAPTSGGWELVVRGRNFGPGGATAPRTVLLRTAQEVLLGVGGLVCGPTPLRNDDDPHGVIRCEVPPGSGADLRVVVATGNLTVAGQLSDADADGVAALFSYDVPAVSHVVSLCSGSGCDGGMWPVEGGFLVLVTGTSLSAAPSVTIGGAVCVPVPSDPRNVPHTAVVCESPQVQGRNRPVVVTSVDQRSGDASVVVDYDGPVITDLSTAEVDATAGSALRVLGRNFGLQVTLGGKLPLVLIATRPTPTVPLLGEADASADASADAGAGAVPSLPAPAGGDGGGVVIDAAAAAGPFAAATYECGEVFVVSNNEIRCQTPEALPVSHAEVVVVSLPPDPEQTDTSWNQTSNAVPITLVCAEGTWAPYGERCRACPAGGDCPGGLLPPVALAGYYELRPTEFFECRPPQACLGGDGSLCAEGYEGSLCSVCSDRFYRLEANCEPCPDAAWLYMVAFFLGISVLLYVAMWLHKRRINVAALGIGVDFLQVVSMFAAFQFDWPLEIKALYTTVSVSNLNVQIIAPECSVSWSYEQHFTFVAALPAMVFGLLVFVIIIVGFKEGRWQAILCPMGIRGGGGGGGNRGVAGNTSTGIGTAGVGGATDMAPLTQALARRQRFKGDTFDALFGMLFTALFYLYLQLCRNGLSMFDCSTSLEGTRVLDADPAIVCDTATDDTYARLYPWAVATFVCYSLGIPAMFAVALYRNRHAIRADQRLKVLGTGETGYSNPQLHVRQRFGRLYNDFSAELYWWRLVLLGRKLLVAATTILFNTYPMFQASVSTGIMFAAYVLQVRYEPFIRLKPLQQTLEELDELDRKLDRLDPSRRQARAEMVGFVRENRDGARSSSTATGITGGTGGGGGGGGDDADSKASEQVVRGGRPRSRGGSRKGLVTRVRAGSRAKRGKRATISMAGAAAGSRPDVARILATTDAKALAYVFDFNRLEASLLVTSVVVLLSGMIFHSNALQRGTIAYGVLTALIATFIVVSVLAFGGIIVFEVYRAIKYAAAINDARDCAERLSVAVKKQETTASSRARTTGVEHVLMQSLGGIGRAFSRGSGRGGRAAGGWSGALSPRRWLAGKAAQASSPHGDGAERARRLYAHAHGSHGGSGMAGDRRGSTELAALDRAPDLSEAADGDSEGRLPWTSNPLHSPRGGGAPGGAVGSGLSGDIVGTRRNPLHARADVGQGKGKGRGKGRTMRQTKGKAAAAGAPAAPLEAPLPEPELAPT